ncbi:Eco57I restriction-modification methylase domain-containing protein [Dubosiella newyorkensis]|uniref:Eco57I restriction-modification methylase domain-containing protein n=1 Tax=Dubosiella newyorkensis TaxID=1862672 RepID=UPI00272A9279|nr:N-6 DNA methylase [Dubosiella newyorkensis]
MNFEWLESKTYTDDLESICKSISKDATLAQTEAQTADAFQRQLYYHIRLKTGVEINFNQEQPISGGLIHEFGSLKKRSSGKGRLDAVVNDLIIEYKKHSKLKNKKDQEIARNQVKDYLNAMFINEKIKYNAILTDGVKISYFEFIGDHVESTAFKYLEAEDIDRIIKAILTHENKKMIPENILRDFAILDQNVQSITKELAISLYHTLTNCPTEKTNMLYCEWERLMHLSFDDHGKGNDINKRREDLARILDTDNIFDSDKEYKALFTLQTTYSIIVKLIACRAIEKLEYSEIKNYSDLTTLNNLGLQQFFEKLEDGYVHRIMNIGNLLEGDFFSWYSEKEQWEKNPDISKCIKKIIIRVDEYSTFSLGLDLKTFDIFKDLYMSIIPKTVRHSMGEYFTPGWLANYVVSEGLQLQENKNWKALDPCCGSGTFIIALINKIIENNKPKNADDSYILSEEQKARIKEKILDSVYGIDINPLSVLSARVSYYLVLRQLGEVENVEIPIYLGDSAITPTQEIIDGIPCYSYYIENAKKPFHVVLPVRFVKLKEFGQIMTTLQNAVRIGNEETLLLTIADYLTDNEKNAKKLMKSIKLMVKDLIELHRSNWDGIWIRIATNFMYIARLDKFDFIVGNPPWVKWEHLPSTYASKIKKLCNIRHIFTTKGQFGGTQLNICALIANVSATNWLKDSGVLAFLMPDSIMSQDSYEEFRHFYLDYENNERLYLQKIDKWEKPLKPFTCENIVVSQDFNTYYYTKKETDYKKGINVRTISRTKAITGSVNIFV